MQERDETGLATALPAAGQAALVLGAGVSGRAAARLLLLRGYSPVVVASETEPCDDEGLLRGACVFRTGALEAAVLEAKKSFSPLALCYASPGLSLTHPGVEAARREGIPLVGELSLGGAFYRGRVTAVTGSKGKSSVVKFLADALVLAGCTAKPCGNYGIPFCAIAAEAEPCQEAIVECSSFQAETATPLFRPDVAVLLNLSKDHLNRHGTMEAYRAAKVRLFSFLPAGALALVPAPSEDAWALAEQVQALRGDLDIQTFGGAASGADWRYEDGHLFSPEGSSCSLRGTYFDNAIVGPAAAAAYAVLVRRGLSTESIEQAFRRFEPLPHRMQRVAEQDGITWIDNSKATNLEALLASVKMAPKPVLLLAGGRLKEPLSLSGRVLLASGVQKVYTYGEASEAMASGWSADLPVARCATLKEALTVCERDICQGAIHSPASVLLAPGTASFDQFRSYAERGDVFAVLVRELLAGKTHSVRP
ncbi:MAG: UDP-N-acetylmuramoyl-L-alanine--D-glutamate ligase [Kiritimatiellia bacterium]